MEYLQLEAKSMDVKQQKKEDLETVLKIFKAMKSGERLELRARLKREDRFIRHQQRFFGPGGQNGVLYDVSGGSGGVLPSLSDEGSNNGTRTIGDNERIITGTQIDGNRTDQPDQGRVCEGNKQDGQECVSSEGQTTQATN